MRIAVGLDLSLDGYDWLLGRAVALANLAGAALDLVYVGDRKGAQRTLDDMLRTVPSDVRGEARVLAGDPADVLIQLTETYDALVVGPREPAGIARLYQNAMAVRVLTRARCPVYIPRTDRLGARRPKLLAGVDTSSDRVDYVVGQANLWSRLLGGTVDLVHAIPRSLPPVRRAELLEAIEREWMETHAEELTRCQAMLDQIAAPRRGTARIAPGEAEDVLVDASEDYDLVLVGNRDRRGLERFLLGGVARTVVLWSKSDVLVLPTATLDTHDDAEPDTTLDIGTDP